MKLNLLPLCTAFGIEMSSTRAKQFSGFNVDRAKSGTKLTGKSDRRSRRVCRIAKCGLRLQPKAQNNSTTVINSTFLFTAFHDRRNLPQWCRDSRKSFYFFKLYCHWTSANFTSITIASATFSQHFSHTTFSLSQRYEKFS